MDYTLIALFSLATRPNVAHPHTGTSINNRPSSGVANKLLLDQINGDAERLYPPSIQGYLRLVSAEIPLALKRPHNVSINLYRVDSISLSS